MNTYSKIITKIKSVINPQKDINYFISNYLRNKKKAVFIQVGSNNGVNNDPLRSFILQKKLTGVLIEPVRYIYNQLINNYPRDLELVFENIAIAEYNGEKDFYRLKKSDNPDLPVWYDQLGSFIPDVILKHKTEIPDIEEYIIIEKIACMTFNSLVYKHALKEINLIHIDTEGFDFEVIKLIDFNMIKPDLIIFEHKHLSVADKENCKNYLKSKNYLLHEYKNDTIALKSST